MSNLHRRSESGSHSFIVRGAAKRHEKFVEQDEQEGLSYANLFNLEDLHK